MRLRSVPEPAGDRLTEIARDLERTGWAFERVDADWCVRWYFADREASSTVARRRRLG